MARVRRRRAQCRRDRRADDRRPPQSLARRSHGRGGWSRDRVGDAELDRRGARGPEADRGAAVARGNPARARLRLHADVQRLRRPDRRPGARPARARPGCRRRLPGACGVPRLTLARRAPRTALRRRRRPARRSPAARIRRSRRDDRLARHRRRRDAPVHPRPAARRGRRARSRRVARSRARTRTSRCGSSGTARRSRACSSAAAGPAGIRGVAPGATILPIRVAGWQPNAEGGFAVYSRTDQLLAGLELAVDPDADGDVLDAARDRGRRRHRAVRRVPRRAGRARGRRRERSWTRWSSSRRGTKARPGRVTAASAAPAARPPRSQSARPISAARRRWFASSSAPGCASCSTASCRSVAPPRRARHSRWR